MNQGVELHPAEEALLARCREIGLDAEETARMRDLMGWNNRDGSQVTWTCHVLPQMRIITEYRNAESEEKQRWENEAKKIADLIRRLLGEETSSSERMVDILRDELGFGSVGIAWLVAQLELTERFPAIEASVCDLIYLSPQKMEQVVAPVMGGLLRAAKPRVGHDTLV